VATMYCSILVAIAETGADDGPCCVSRQAMMKKAECWKR
jgi:hypothetical protein